MSETTQAASSRLALLREARKRGLLDENTLSVLNEYEKRLPMLGPTIGARHSVTGLKPEPEFNFPPVEVPKYGTGGNTVAALSMLGKGASDRFQAGLGKMITDTGRGIEQRYRALTGEESPELTADIAESRKLDAPLMRSGPGQLGNTTGYLVGAGLVPGQGTLAGTALQAGLIGATQPTTEDESALSNTLKAVGTAGGVHAGMSAASRMLSPRVNPQARMLMDEGVDLTPGQIVGQGGIVGRTVKALEDKATSIPLLGDMINEARTRGIRQFSLGAINRVLRPIGGRVSDAGHAGLEEAHRIARQAYDDVLPNITLRVDPVLGRELAGIDRLTANLSDAGRQQFNRTMQNEVLGRFTATQRGAAMSGEAFKRADSELGRLIRAHMKSLVAAEQELGRAFSLAQRTLRNAVNRTNPSQRAALRQADSAYRGLLRVEGAGASTGAREGVFTPAQLKSVVKAMDPSLRKRAYAQGRAELQDYSEAGQAVLPSGIPDSGTAGRGIFGALMAGGAGYIEPWTLAATLGSTGAYTQPGIRAAQALLARRPGVVRGAGDAIQGLIPYATSAAAAGSRNIETPQWLQEQALTGLLGQ